MTISGTVNRYARFRSGEHVATVTRVNAPDGAVYIAETVGPDGPVFTPCGSWRSACAIAARSIRHALQDAALDATGGNVRLWA